jgi:hypothetical protein
MSSRLAILAGLISGLLVAVVFLGGLYALAPEQANVIPTPVAGSPSPEPSATGASAAPSAASSATPSQSGPPDASAGASTSASAGAAALFHIGEPAPALARGLQTILPGVTLTP